ncbi:MAG: nitroreductase family protein [Prevotella sp.]|nr:nitroreductase family protein [Bacteroides sp.]MCM1365911.1 nitroreductase family protein [Prevotella sp.]
MNKLDILSLRHSVRNYDGTPLDNDISRLIKSEISFINTHEPGFFFTLITNDDKPFKGFSRSYGLFRGVNNYIAAIVDSHFPDTIEKAGFYAEQIVIKATELGIGTCFVGGTYRASDVNIHLRAGQTILFLIALGTSDKSLSTISRLATSILHRKKMTATDFFTPQKEIENTLGRYKFLNDGLKAVSLAPSSRNRRPVRISLNSDGEITAFVPKATTESLIDLGIAKYNFQYAVGGAWKFGNNAPYISD